VVTMAMMVLAGRLSGIVQPKWQIVFGALVMALGMYLLTNLYGDLNFGFFAWARIVFGFGLPFIFIPITSASYDGLKPEQTDQASALINAARNTGGSIGVSIAANVLAYRSQFHQSRLVEHIVPSEGAYQDTLRRMTDYFATRGATTTDAQNQAVAWIGQQIQTQTAYWAYIDVFFVLGVIGLVIVPLGLSLRSVKLGAAPAGAH
jgi:MFS transporter, DHA2 family, multidrug resistance protein